MVFWFLMKQLKFKFYIFGDISENSCFLTFSENFLVKINCFYLNKGSKQSYRLCIFIIREGPGTWQMCKNAQKQMQRPSLNQQVHFVLNTELTGQVDQTQPESMGKRSELFFWVSLHDLSYITSRHHYNKKEERKISCQRMRAQHCSSCLRASNFQSTFKKWVCSWSGEPHHQLRQVLSPNRGQLIGSCFSKLPMGL